MGTHPNVPSTLHSDPSETLASYIKSNPTLIGEKVSSKFEAQDGNLPFLFKVLSIGTALSIQAHPDKKLAQRLFKEHGDIYKGKQSSPSLRRSANKVLWELLGGARGSRVVWDSSHTWIRATPNLEPGLEIEI